MSASDSLCPRLHYLLSGTFNTLFLYLLAFSPYAPGGPTLAVHRKYRAEGPHQFLALSEDRTTAYATTWAQPPTLSSWEVLAGGRDGVRKVNTVPICALPRPASLARPRRPAHPVLTHTPPLSPRRQLRPAPTSPSRPRRSASPLLGSTRPADPSRRPLRRTRRRAGSASSCRRSSTWTAARTSCATPRRTRRGSRCGTAATPSTSTQCTDEPTSLTCASLTFFLAPEPFERQERVLTCSLLSLAAAATRSSSTRSTRTARSSTSSRCRRTARKATRAHDTASRAGTATSSTS